MTLHAISAIVALILVVWAVGFWIEPHGTVRTPLDALDAIIEHLLQ